MNNTHTVLITGATSGIGLELARFFARDHYTLAIVSRETQKAEQTARELKAAGATDVHVITADLAEPTGPEQVFAATKKAGLHIDILVNDAGVGVHGKFAETDLQEEIRIVQLNVISLVHLTKLYLREMLPKKKGRILQLASVASYQPTPLLAVYAATKAFVLSFSDAIANELEGTGITVTSLIPGPTDTDFFRKADAEHTKAAQDNPEDPAVVAEIGYKALMDGELHAVAPGVKQQIVMSSVMPNEQVAAKAREQMEEDDAAE